MIMPSENGSFCNFCKTPASTREIPTTSETTSENASGEAAPAADVAADKGKCKREKTHYMSFS